MITAWSHAATEHLDLRYMYTVGGPYLTLYRCDQIVCSCHEIMEDVYDANGKARASQKFLCASHQSPGASLDVINAHAPAGPLRLLRDSQRKELIERLLQSKSNAKSGKIIGNTPFVIGGDMNTPPQQLKAMVHECADQLGLRINSICLLYTSPSPRDGLLSRMPSSA